MSDAEDVQDPTREARTLVAASAAWIRELAEEGVSEFERLELAPMPVDSAPDRHGSPTAAPPSAETRQTPPPRHASSPASPPAAAATIAAEPETAGWSADDRPSLEHVRARLGDCTRCELCQGRKTIVFGDGDPGADLMFIGEGPGEQEDLRGLPFVGRAGELLTQMIEKGIGIPRAEVYICNIVKCRPPRNRNPLPPEVAACRPFLDGQILAVQPKVIVTLGKPAASLLLGRDIAITRVRGTWHDYHGIPLMPTLHPAYLLRQYTPENRRAVWQDLQAAIERTRA